MINNGRSIDVNIILYDNATHTSNMRIYAVPIANLCVMPNYSVRLNHIVVSNLCIITYHRIGPNEVALPQLDISINACRLMNQLHKLTATTDNFFHTGPTSRSAN